MYQEALDVFARALPPAHPRVLTVRGGLARCLTRASRFDEAEALLTASLETAGVRILGTKHRRRSISGTGRLDTRTLTPLARPTEKEVPAARSCRAQLASQRCWNPASIVGLN